MEEVDAEISEMKLFLNGRARFVAEGYLAQVFPPSQNCKLIPSSHNRFDVQICRIRPSVVTYDEFLADGTFRLHRYSFPILLRRTFRNRLVQKTSQLQTDMQLHKVRPNFSPSPFLIMLFPY
jgi:hypothetical protein